MTRYMVLQGFSERMMGLEPTTFCMADAGGRSHPFARVRRNLSFAAASVEASERQRTRANAYCSHCSHCDRCHVRLAESTTAAEAVEVARRDTDSARRPEAASGRR